MLSAPSFTENVARCTTIDKRRVKSDQCWTSNVERQTSNDKRRTTNVKCRIPLGVFALRLGFWAFGFGGLEKRFYEAFIRAFDKLFTTNKHPTGSDRFPTGSRHPHFNQDSATIPSFTIIFQNLFIAVSTLDFHANSEADCYSYRTKAKTKA